MTGLSPSVFLESIFRNALHRCHPNMLLPPRLPDWLTSHGLSDRPRLHVFACGKAAATMAHAAVAVLKTQVADGWMVTPNENDSAPSPLQRFVSDHPVPTDRSRQAAKKLKQALSGLPPHAGYLFLLSGGTSSMLEDPKPPLSLAELQTTWRILLRSGLNIHALNRIRTRLSTVKAGGLLSGIQAKGLVVVMSDVPGNDLAVVGSGPLHPFAGPENDDIPLALERAGIWNQLPETARHILSLPIPPTQDLPPTPPHVLLASNDTLVRAACRVSAELGVPAQIHPRPLTGEAQTAGSALARWCIDRQAQPGPSREVWIAGGETTVTVRGSGTGGRNQEAALAALLALRGHPGIFILFAGSDGIDGPTPAAGAIAGPDAWHRAHRDGIQLEKLLHRHDSHTAWHALGGLLATGPTGINLMDVAIALIER